MPLLFRKLRSDGLTKRSNRPFLLGLLCLVFGLVLYGQETGTYLGQKLRVAESWATNPNSWLGPLRGPLPEFIHPLAFSLIGMHFFARTRKHRFWICSSLFFHERSV